MDIPPVGGTERAGLGSSRCTRRHRPGNHCGEGCGRRIFSAKEELCSFAYMALSFLSLRLSRIPEDPLLNVGPLAGGGNGRA